MNKHPLRLLLALLMAESSKNFPQLAGIVLNGGFEISSQIRELVDGLAPTLPVITTDGKSFDTTVKIAATRGRSATTVAAEFLGWEKDVGSLTPGHYADMIELRKNPLEDVTELERVVHVIKGGVVVR
mgnify:CR=1 FL=1